MRITILASGSRGDVQPYVALGRGLQRAGHSVLVVTNDEFGQLVGSYGLATRLVPIGAQKALQDPRTRAALEGSSVIRSFAHLARIARRAARLTTEYALDAARGSDALLAGITGLFVAGGIAEVLGLPLIQALNVPLTPTRAFAGALVELPPIAPSGIRNRLSHLATRQLLWLASRSAGNEARRQVLGLPSAPVIARFGRGPLASGPVLYGISPAVIAKPDDWDSRVEVTGFWFLDEPLDWEPPAELSAFLEAGPPPVYVGFGSMSHRDPSATLRIVLEAVERTDQRAIVLSGWGGLRGSDLPARVLVIDAAPHAWLFPRVAAVVHHGGAGTTSAGIRAGVPSIIVPFHGDQPFWGRIVAGLGVGPAPIHRRRLSATSLSAAIGQALGDDAMRLRAAHLGVRVRSEDGVARAVEVIGRLDRRR